MPATVGQIARLLEHRYPIALAADWDAVGLVCGDPASTVRRVLFAVDPVQEVVDEALLLQADMIVTHHPLLLRAVHSVAPVDRRGTVLHTLITHGVALYAAHTNADHARPGVSDALADLLGILDTSPLVPEPGDPRIGTGRFGRLDEALTFAAFVERVWQRLPATVAGVRAAGDPDRLIETVAVCGGSGDAFLPEAGAIADAYVTSDLRHHRAQDHVADTGCALVDVAHWAGEWPWLGHAAAALATDAAEAGTTVEVHVSTIVTDPWTLHRGSPVLNADPALQLRLLDLQEHDTRLTQLDHRASHLPDSAVLADIDTRLTRLRDEVIAAETIASDLEADLERAERDVEQVRERRRRDQDLMDSGSVGDPKQLQAIAAEMESLVRRQSALEDVELEVMERVEGARAAVAQLTQSRDALADERSAVAQRVQEQLAEIEGERATVVSERDHIAGEIPADLLALYNKIRADAGGIGAAPLHRGSCQGCRLALPPTEIEALRSTPPDAVVRCEECRRILVRTSESGL